MATSSDQAVPALDPAEQAEARERASPRAAIIHAAVLQEGEEELARPASSLFWSGLAAGLSMGFSMVGHGVLAAGLPDTPWRPLVSSIGYSFGFLIVILARQQLFTENTLTVVLPLLHRRSWVGWRDVARLWSIVLFANLLGTWLFAGAAAGTGVFSPEAGAAFQELGVKAAQGSAGAIFGKAVLAGWIIALLVLLLPASGSAKPFLILALTYLIGIAELAHVIAGSVEVAFAAFQGAVDWSGYAGGFLLPTLAGNIVGGTGLVALISHAQVRDET
jgi:formate/nitrite transporter FocA (FNT family)